MPEFSFELEIPEGLHTDEDLKNLVAKNISNITNTPINGCLSIIG
jgi:hypothetical protein